MPTDDTTRRAEELYDNLDIFADPVSMIAAAIVAERDRAIEEECAAWLVFAKEIVNRCDGGPYEEGEEPDFWCTIAIPKSLYDSAGRAIHQAAIRSQLKGG